MIKLLKWTFCSLLILFLSLYLFLHYQWSPYGRGANVYLPKGSSATAVAKILEKSGVIRNVWSFKVLLRFSKNTAPLQSGEYEFSPKMDSIAVLEKLQRGDRIHRKLTIPEGYRFDQIGTLLVQAKIATPEDIKFAFRDSKYLEKLPFSADSLEGYLYPATYEYDRGTKLDVLIPEMLESFQKSFDAGMRLRAQQMGWTIPQVVTLASIIEKETGQDGERSRISGVFHNRLRQGIPLQSDPTVIYGLANYDGNIRRVDLQNPHPYNTYVHAELPPAPIASPGKASLMAALYPMATEELYFVSKGDGSHQFSKTLAEHQAAVQLYQIKNNPSAPKAENKM